MSIKMKLVSCISAFILVLGIFIFGVLSAEQATVNLGGSISFDATDVYARVTGEVQNAQTNPTLETLEFSAYNDTPDQSSWSGLELQFDSRATNITIEVTVENLSMERTLTVNLTDMIETSTDNLGKSITLDNGAYVSGTNTTVPVATSNDETNTSKITFVITFDVIDHNRSLPNTIFDYDINLMDESTIPETYQPFEFEVIEGTENEVRITKHNGSGDVVIPASFSVDSIPITSFTMQSENDASMEVQMGNIALYLGEFYYTETGGERTKTNMLEFSNLLQSESLTFPITFEPTYRYEFEGYSDINAVLLLYAIIVPSDAGYTDNINYNLTNDEFATGRDFTTQEMISYITENYPNVGSDPTTLVPLFSTKGPTILETNPIVTSVMIEGTDYVVTEIAAATAENTGYYVEYFGSFSNNETITNIYIPNTVRSIGNNAFGIDYSGHYTSNLKSVVFEDNSQLESIGDYAFRMCKNLTTIDFGENSQLTNIGDYAFDSCSGLTSITIPEGVTNIGSYAFHSCSGLTTVNFGENSQLTSVGDYAFYSCSGLTSITIPDSVASIGDWAFYSCSGLTTVNFGENSQLTSISSYAFCYCTSLTSITIPEEVTSIGINAFSRCSSLTSITIPSSVTSIGDYAFRDCSGLTSITIPSSVTSIGINAFSDCRALTEINYNATNAADLAYNNRVFYNAGRDGDGITVNIGANVTRLPNRIFCPYNNGSNSPNITTVNFAEGSVCESIGIYAFNGCTSLTSITIPKSVTSIGDYAFESCSSLTTINFGENSQLTSIGDYAFAYCSSLASITIPENVTSIDRSAFYYCSSLTSITIPESVTSIGSFAFQNCSSLSEVIFENQTGWFTATSATATSGTPIEDLSDPEQNAEWLTSTSGYYNRYWKRS